jgi:hypothetical protein
MHTSISTIWLYSRTPAGEELTIGYVDAVDDPPEDRAGDFKNPNRWRRRSQDMVCPGVAARIHWLNGTNKPTHYRSGFPVECVVCSASSHNV